MLQFRVPKNIKRDFKQRAVEEDLSMTELFLKLYHKRQVLSDPVQPNKRLRYIIGIEKSLLQFRIHKNVRRDFKRLALKENVTLTELFLKMYEHYR